MVQYGRQGDVEAEQYGWKVGARGAGPWVGMFTSEEYYIISMMMIFTRIEVKVGDL